MLSYPVIKYLQKFYANLPEPSKELFRSWRRFALRILGYSDYTRFILLGYPRTGSSYLAIGLQSCRGVEMHHEIFRASKRPYCQRGSSFEAIFSTFTDLRWPWIKAVGAKVFYEHLSEDEWQHFVEHQEFKILHLLRRNRLRTLISLDIAMGNQQWNCSDNNELIPTKEKRVFLDPNSVFSRIEQLEQLEKIARMRFKRHAILELYYEDMIVTPEATFEKISTFLNIPRIEFSKISMKKQNPEPLQILLTNYHDIEAALRATKYEEYLEY